MGPIARDDGLKTLLVANRSEIAVRCFRAAAELGLRTIAVYSHEDRFSSHRFKADEAYRIGPKTGGEAVRSYLDVVQIVATAKRHGADAIHPGYGFLSENVEFARACVREGIVFVGPTIDHLEMFGDKTAAKQLAARVGVPTIPGAVVGRETNDLDDIEACVGFPLIVKASFGGGGRGMRVVLRPDDLQPSIEAAAREADGAFGRGDVFVERYINRAKHIEVQLLGDAHGNLVHLWDRDCSVQRRHQKVVEIAPSPTLTDNLRAGICAAAVRIGTAVGYQSAGTVEFLVDLDAAQFYFIEMNPRIQVEHTVTELVTGIDLVKSQLLIAQGHALHKPPVSIPSQSGIAPRGYALQCRITTEDPENHFIPDYGRLTTYRAPEGFAVRLDGGNAFGGAVITPYFDSLLVKLSTWGLTLEEAVRRAERALREFRVRGVKTNIGFLLNLLAHPTFASGEASTTFLDDARELFRIRAPRDRATRLLAYIADVLVNGRADIGDRAVAGRSIAMPLAPRRREPTAPLHPPMRDRLRELGPERFAEWVRAQRQVLVTDTTFRDAHQSLLATRVRTFDMLGAAEVVQHSLPNLFSLEMWGGATFDTAMRFLQEDPWDRLIELRRIVPGVPFQMLLRASNAVGYTSYPDNVVREFVRCSAANGIDVFRIFDSLNAPQNMRVAIEAVREHTPAVCEAAICYTGDILDPARTKYSLQYYIRLAKELVSMGTHMLAIKDMAGLCKPYAAYALVKALRHEVGVPLHFHTHDTGGISAASVLRAVDAGVDVIDGAVASMSGMTSQPCLNSLVAALRHTDRDPSIDLAALDTLSGYWSAARDLYFPFEEAMRAPLSDVYDHEMPGGQYTNLKQQAKSVGLAHRWPEVCDAYAAANQLCGDIVKVTPSSKVIGDLALFMVTNNLRAEDVLNPERRLQFPQSVVDMMQGGLGRPDGGWPEHFQRIILTSAGVSPLTGRVGESLPSVDFGTGARELSARLNRSVRREDVLSSVLYPQVFSDFQDHVRQYGDMSVLPTRTFFYGMEPGEEIAVDIERGKTLIVRYLTTGELHNDGTRTVFFELNGQPRDVRVVDRRSTATIKRRPKADGGNPAHIGTQMPGKISAVFAAQGQNVAVGTRLAAIEAMKMEAAIMASRDGVVREVIVAPGDAVEAGDLLFVVE